MVRYLLSPQLSNATTLYSWAGDTLTATVDGVTETIDFSGLPEGMPYEAADTCLPFFPIISAMRREGILEVVLLNCITESATLEERFPDWVEV